MGIWIRDAVRGVLRQPVRSALLVATFAIGFAMVLMVIGSIEGGRQKIRESLYALGIDVIAVLNPIRVEGVPFLKIGRGGDRLIDREALHELTDEVGDSVRSIAPLRLEMTVVERGDQYSTNTMVATSPAYTSAIRTGLLAGRFLEEGDLFREGAENNVVFDEALARIFEPTDPADVVGLVFEAKRHRVPFKAKVVGVLKDPIVLRRHMGILDSQAKARTVTSRRLEFLNVYVLYDPAVDEPSGAMVQVKQIADIDPLYDRLFEFFDSRGIDPYYHVQKTWVDSVLDVVDNFSILLHFLWVVSLGVVVILTATITYLAVEERYVEVAIQRVEGARISDVVAPLLGEGVLLSLISAPIGYLIAEYALSAFIVEYLWEPVIPPLAIWGTPLLLVIVALATYSLPAWRIARLEPAVVLDQCAE